MPIYVRMYACLYVCTDGNTVKGKISLLQIFMCDMFVLEKIAYPQMYRYVHTYVNEGSLHVSVRKKQIQGNFHSDLHIL